MTDPRSRPDDAPLGGEQPLDADVSTLLGEEAVEDQDGALDISEIEPAREPTLTELDSGAVTIPDREYAAEGRDPGRVTSLDAATDSELREGETDDPIVAIEEGLTYVPPSDPPTAPSDDRQGIEIAAGFGASGADGPLDDDHRTHENVDESDLNARIREAIRADAATSPYADRLLIAVVGGTVVVRGTLDELDDGDTLVGIIERIPGITLVRDETEVASLD